MKESLIKIFRENRKKKKGITVVFACILLLSSCNSTENTPPVPEEKLPAAEYTMEEAAQMPYGKYPELITYSLGKIAADSDSNLPEGDTYENNAYTRYIKEMLNVQNQNVFEASGTHYDSVVNMAIANNDLPDIMLVQDEEIFKRLVEQDMIEDLTASYETCASDRLKDIYSSYGDKLLGSVTFDGRIMGFPETNIDSSPSFLWLRKDWMDKLGLEDPKTLNDAVEIVRQFVEKDPGNNGPGNTTGLVFDPEGLGNGDKCYQMDIVFASFGAYPQKWIRDEEGKVIYGSIAPQAKEALEYLQSLYREEILDQQFLVRTIANVDNLIADEKCGSFFGLWWAPNNPLMSAISQNPEAQWQPYVIATEADGVSVKTFAQPLSQKYIVVRKGYEHPEIAIKILNVIFDHTRYTDRDNKEMQEYFSLNVNPTARPLAINVDYKQALFLTTESIEAALKGEKKREDLLTIEKSYYDMCVGYLDHPKKPSPEEWAAYVSRITSVELLAKAKVEYIENLFEGTTATMKSEGWNLDLLEKNAYLKIISGDVDVDYFDTFVEEWMEQGGAVITKEVEAAVSK